jgi:hypothetical protein
MRSSKLTILYMHLDRRSIWGFAHPRIQVLALASLEEEHIVAVIEFGELVELVQFCLGVQLCFLTAMRKERIEVVEEMSVSVCDWLERRIPSCHQRLRTCMLRLWSSASGLAVCFP